ncbi:hypothetical protein CWI21_32150 [Pseudomonas aeruginosa]|nr:hypothetical protein CWI20_32150 [Pseudomonas aeruginosa]QHC83075.1 hypothetical protein CWI21_32150 [Pseudomonas aeruginosa]
MISKQPGSHAYKKATVERPDIPNILNWTTPDTIDIPGLCFEHRRKSM